MFTCSVWRIVGFVLVCLLVLGLSLAWSYVAVQDRLIIEHRSLQAALQSELERYQSLPGLMSRDPRLADLLQERRKEQVDDVNQILALWAKRASIEHFFLMDINGTTVAASNWDTPLSFLGRNYGFRPYYKGAINNGFSSFFAVGATTGKPGYFLANAVANPQGLTQRLSALSRRWMIVDDLGISILSSDPALLYRIWQNRPGQIESAKAQSRYSVREAGFDKKGGLVHFHSPTDEKQFSDLGFFLEGKTPIEPWHFVTVFSFRKAVVLFAIRCLFLSLLLIVIYLGLRLFRSERRKNRALDKQAKQIRRELKQTQAELLREENWAAMGRMSGAIAHEINQPLSSLRFDMASAGKLLDSDGGSQHDLAEVIKEAKSTLTKVTRIIETLRLFARQNELPLEVCDTNAILQSALGRFAKERPLASRCIINQGNASLNFLRRILSNRRNLWPN